MAAAEDNAAGRIAAVVSPWDLLGRSGEAVAAKIDRLARSFDSALASLQSPKWLFLFIFGELCIVFFLVYYFVLLG